ncbi:MAG: phosphate ABC transporter permease PstA [Pirellulales bacterium]
MDQQTAKIVARRKREDRVFNALGIFCTLLALATLALLLGNLLYTGLSRIDWQFLTSFPSRKAENAGILSAAVGTLAVIAVTAFTAVPLGIAAGVYMEEYARKGRISTIIEVNIANLAGVPSVIYGLMGLGLFVYYFHLGHSILSAGLTLGLLVLPIVIVATREALRTIPVQIREAAYALGATKWQVVRHHLLRYAVGGISTGVIIAISRAVGETAPLIVIGAVTFIRFLPPSPITNEFPFVSWEWLQSPFAVLPNQMFDWTSRPTEDFHRNAAASGIVLIAATLTMNAVAIFVRYRARRNIKW